MSSKQVPLREIIQGAKTVRAGAADLPILSMTMKQGLVDQSEKFKKRVASADTGQYKVIARNQLVVGFPIDEGVLAFQARYDHALVSPAYDVWDLVDPARVLPKYLELFLRSPAALDFYGGKLRGTTARRRTLPDDIFLSLEVPLPPLAEQHRIAAILDKADAIRRKRAQATTMVDDLLRSVFLEMLGDPLTNPKGWPVRPLSECYGEDGGPTCGPFGSALKKGEYAEVGIPVWNMDNISEEGRLQLPPRLWIGPAKRATLEHYAVRQGDIIISRAGTVGKMCVVDTSFPDSIISTNLIRLRLNPGVLQPRYFVALMTICKGRVGRLKTGGDGAFTHMNTGVLNGLRIPVPPPTKQRDFLKVLDSIERINASSATMDGTTMDAQVALTSQIFR